MAGYFVRKIWGGAKLSSGTSLPQYPRKIFWYIKFFPELTLMASILINYKHEPGDLVYLITDEDQSSRMVLSFTYDGSSEIMYTLMRGTTSSTHYSKEISREKNFVSR